MASYGEGNRIRVLNRVKLPHSLGQFYSAATNFLGFDMFQGDEYKVMGVTLILTPIIANCVSARHCRES